MLRARPRTRRARRAVGLSGRPRGPLRPAAGPRQGPISTAANSCQRRHATSCPRSCPDDGSAARRRVGGNGRIVGLASPPRRPARQGGRFAGRQTLPRPVLNAALDDVSVIWLPRRPVLGPCRCRTGPCHTWHRRVAEEPQVQSPCRTRGRLGRSIRGHSDGVVDDGVLGGVSRRSSGRSGSATFWLRPSASGCLQRAPAASDSSGVLASACGHVRLARSGAGQQLGCAAGGPLRAAPWLRRCGCLAKYRASCAATPKASPPLPPEALWPRPAFRSGHQSRRTTYALPLRCRVSRAAVEALVVVRGARAGPAPPGAA